MSQLRADPSTEFLMVWGGYVMPRFRGTPASRVLMQALLRHAEAMPAELRMFAAYGDPTFRRGDSSIAGASTGSASRRRSGLQP